MSGTLVVQNLLYQWMLVRVTGISAFPVRYRRAYSSILMIVLGLQVVEVALDLALIPGLALATIASALVFWINRDLLDIQRTFPEILRVPFMRQVLGAQSR
jgi:hypothetical protein